MARLPDAVHAEQPWRIHELARDFAVEDVWAIRTPGAGPDDFPAMLEAIAGDGAGKQPLPVRFLFAVRLKLGAVLGWDAPSAGTPSLRDRLPGDLRAAPGAKGLPLEPLYETDREAAREVANKTVHAVLHLGWVPGATGDYELHMAVLVKPTGLLGRTYMAAIAPFRYVVVYPAMIRRWEQAWLDRATAR